MNRRAPSAISIIALVFAPIGIFISFGMYSSDAVWNEMPLLAMAIAVGALETCAAVATLRRSRRGPQLFLAYGALALVLVIVDLVFLFGMPTVTEPPPNGVVMGRLIEDGFDLVAIIFHLLYAVCALAWPIVAMALAGGRGRREAQGVPFLLPQMR